MTEIEHKTTRELMATIDSKNRRFKTFSVIFFAALAAGLVALLLIGISTLDRVDQQLSQQKKLLSSQQQALTAIKKNGDTSSKDIKDLQNHIDCIVELFKLPNRQNLTLNDLNGCHIDSSGNVIPGGIQGGNNGQTQNTTKPNNGNGGAATSPQPNSSGTILPTQTPQAPQTGPVTSVTNGLFCPISLTSLACRK